MVLMESAVSGHKITCIRERLADKLEFIKFDPYSKYVCYMTATDSVVQCCGCSALCMNTFCSSSYPHDSS
jgi:hypothetical protein